MAKKKEEKKKEEESKEGPKMSNKEKMKMMLANSGFQCLN